jgi:conjugative transfer pilus assembly protein TraH
MRDIQQTDLAVEKSFNLTVQASRTVRRKLRSSFKKMGLSLATAAFVLNPLGHAAHANVDSEMRNFMNDTGTQANVTGPTAYQGQSAGYYSMGSVWSRFPQKNVQPFNLQLPSARAGCGGIDLFAGSFSYINTAELVAMLKATANNAVGFAFKLAIDTISPEIGKVMDELAQKVQQMNQMNISSCETAQALVGGLWPKTDTASSVVCEAIANSQGRVADWARARQDCNNGGNRASHINANNDLNLQEQPGMKANYTWLALSKRHGALDTEFKEFLMTMVGTVIYSPPATDTAKGSFKFISPADQTMMTAMLDGTNLAPLRIYKCDEPVNCLNPTLQTVTISPSAAVKPRVQALIQQIYNKVRQPNSPLTNQEIQLLGLASLPVYKILTVSAAAEFGVGIAEINNISELVAIDLVSTMALRFIDTVNSSKSDFQGADEASLIQWRQELGQARSNFYSMTTRATTNFDNAFRYIERTQLLEKTLRTQLSPQLAASMRFSKSLSSANIQ